MFCSSVVCLKRKGDYFRWIEVVISLLVLSLTLQLKANDCVWTNYQIDCVFVYESNTKDSVYNTHLNFRSFFSGKKRCIIHGEIRYSALSGGSQWSRLIPKTRP